MLKFFILNKKNIILILIVILIAEITLNTSCVANKNNQNTTHIKNNSSPQVIVASSILPIYSIVAMAIDGIPAYQNQLIIMPHVDEHEAKLSLQDIYKLKSSSLVFITSAELEKHIILSAKKHNYLHNIVALGDSSRIVRYNLDLSFLEHTLLKHQHNSPEETDEAELDPHLWLSVNNAKIMLENVVEKLISLTPAYKEQLENNKIKYLNLLTQLNFYVINELKDNNKTVISYHNAWKYFAADFNIHYMGSITSEQDEELHNSFSPKALSMLINAIKEQNIQCIFNEEQFQDPILATISKKTGIKILPLNPMGIYDKKTNPAQIYFDMIKYNTQQFKNC